MHCPGSACSVTGIRHTITLHFSIFPLGITLYVNHVNLGKVQTISYINAAVCIYSHCISCKGSRIDYYCIPYAVCCSHTCLVVLYLPRRTFPIQGCTYVIIWVKQRRKYTWLTQWCTKCAYKCCVVYIMPAFFF
jgi:hypothetical protein